jgi:alpha-ribazole phosphatase
MSTATSKNPDSRFRIHVVRHGEVAPQWKGKIYGGLDVELAPEGRQRFVDLAPCAMGSPITALYSSGLSRAIHGVSCFAEVLSLEPVQDVRFNEIDRGDWAGLSTEEIERRWPGGLDAYKASPGSYTGHGGETFAALLARVLPALEELSQRHVGEEVLLVCHAQVIRVLVSGFLMIPEAQSLLVMLSHGGITTLDRFADGLWVVQSVNAPTLRQDSWASRYKKP